MCNVLQENRSLQCAFLIDVNAENLLNEIKPSEVSNAIRLCALRILTYFSDQLGKGNSNLRWGYKFYNSRAITHLYERHEFREFRADYFEEFEQDICKRLDESFVKANETQVNNSDIQDGGVHVSSCQKPSPAKCLTCALTDLVHDFEWEQPEISSPFKRPRQVSQAKDVNNNSNANFVFLFSWCPCSKGLMSSFCDRSIKSCENFQKVVLPAALRKKFHGNCKISLLWIDTGLWWWRPTRQVLKDWSCKSLVQEFTKSLGGCLIPLSALVHLETFNARETVDNAETPQDGDIAAELSFCRGVTHCGILLPFASVMNYFLYQCDIGLADLELKTSCSVVGDDSWTGLLCTTGNSKIVHCTVKLNPIFNHISLGPPEDSSISNNQNSSDDQAGVFWIQGVVQRQEVCPSWLHPTKSYSCVGFATNGPSFSGWFQELMAALSKQNLLLVIDFPDPNNGLPVTGVIQPLTSISGVLSVTNPDAMLRVEKLLLWHGKRAAGAVDPPGDADSSDRTGGERVSKKQHSQSAKGNAEKENSVTKAGSIFSASDLNPLHARRNSAASISLLEELTSVSLQEDSDDWEDVSELVRQLKELYSKKSKHSSSGSRKTKHHKQQEGDKESTTPKQRKRQKPNSRDRRASSNEKLKKRKSAESSSVSCTDIQTEVEKQISGTDKEVETTNVAEKEHTTVEFQDKNELIQYLKEVYSTMVAQDLESTAPDTARQLVEATVQFSTCRYPKDVEVETRSVLDENLLVKHHNLREKYEGQEDTGVKQHKLNEYHLQVLLRMELAAALSSASSEDQLIDEVTVMLRTISFLKDPGFLSYYLREELLSRYGKLIPKFVCGVYEGLMQDPPDELLSPSKRNVEESPGRSAKPASITTQDSQEPRSEGGRVFTRHKSVSDLGKRREIVVPGKAKSKASQKQVKQAAKKAKKETPKTPVKKVRRNLFTGAESEEPVKEQMRQGQPKGSEVRQQASRRHSVAVAGSLKTVQETPARKQIANALWRRQHRARKRASTMTDVKVVQESPLKQLREGDPLPRRSPRRHKGYVVFQRSQSFYGRSASAKPLTRTKSFTATSVRESPSKSPELENIDQPKDPDSPGSPTAENSATKTPVKTLSMASKVISPLRFSPRLRKRFSLHSLLKTTMDSADSVPAEKVKAIPKTPDSKRPQGLRSSPRLLKRRSFSCIGFSSTAPLEKQQRTRSQMQGIAEAAPITSEEPQSKNTLLGSPVCTSPSRQGMCESSELNSITTAQPSTPDNNIPQDDVESFITPVKQVASSPVRFSPAPCESNLPETPKRASSRSRKKLLKRTSVEKTNREEEPTMAKKTKELSPSPSRSLWKRASSHEALCLQRSGINGDSSPSERNNTTTNSKTSLLSPSRLHRSSNSEKTVLQESCKVIPSKTIHSSSSPMKASDSTTNCGTQNVTEEAPSPKKSTNVGADASSRRLQTRTTQRHPSNEEQVTPAEKPANSKSAMRPTTHDFVTGKSTASVEDVSDKKKSPESEKKRSYGSRRSPGSGETAKGDADTSCPTDVLQLSGSPLRPCAVYLSPLRLLSGGSPKDSKTSVSSRIPISTPPMKRSRGSRILGSPTDRKRLSPLNQILKQRKLKHQGLNKSPVAKDVSSSPESVHSGFSYPDVATPNTKKVARNAKRKKWPKLTLPSQSPENSRNISRSSDEGNDWLDEIEMDQQRCTILVPDDVLCETKQSSFESDSSPTSPCSKKRRIDKSVVFGGRNFKKPHPKRVSFSGSCSKARRRSSEAFDGDPDDDVFQSLVSISIPLKRTKIPSTPLSLSSIRQLQESPILFGSPKSIFNTSPSKFRISPSSFTKKWTEFSPDAKLNDRRARLRLRRHTNKSDTEPCDFKTDVLLNDRENIGTENEESEKGAEPKPTCSLKLRKRLQLAH